MNPIQEMRDSRQMTVGTGMLPDNAMNLISVRKKQLRQVGAVLAGYAGNEHFPEGHCLYANTGYSRTFSESDGETEIAGQFYEMFRQNSRLPQTPPLRGQ